MRALRFTGVAAELDPRAPEPVAGPGEAIIAVRAVGLTEEDLTPCASERPGRDFVGVVERVEGHATLLGARVVTGGDIPCGACHLCRSGLAVHCPDRGTLGSTRAGACAERLALPVRSLLPIPDTLADEPALFAREVAWALLVARAVEIQSRPFVTVLGDSVAAIVCAQVLAARNASVRLLGERPERFGLCERWGVKHRHRSEVGRRADQGVVVDCTGRASGMALACELLRPRGTIIIGHAAPAPCELGRIAEGEFTLMGLRAGLLPEALDLLAHRGVETTALVSRRARFTEAPAAIAELLRAESLKTILHVASEAAPAAPAARRRGVSPPR